MKKKPRVKKALRRRNSPNRRKALRYRRARLANGKARNFIVRNWAGSATGAGLV